MGKLINTAGAGLIIGVATLALAACSKPADKPADASAAPAADAAAPAAAAPAADAAAAPAATPAAAPADAKPNGDIKPDGPDTSTPPTKQ